VANKGDNVKVHYKGTLKDGSVFDSSEGRGPLAFTVGAGQMIAGFDKAVVGMKVGEKKTITIPFAEAYGPHDDNLVFDVPRDRMPANYTPKVGDQLGMQQPDGRTATVVVIAVKATSVTLDANHPMAGKDLTFEITMVEIKKPA
jgi:peptidylprolyl isomerase